jgi:HEPN domain-containing protein
MSRKEEIEHLLSRSREFLETAKYQSSAGFYSLAAFSLEQSLQLFIKARLLENGVDYPRTHSVRTLIEVLSSIVDERRKDVIKGMLDKYLLELGMLEDAYISSRCIVREFRREEVEKLRIAVEEVMRNVS